MTDTISVKSAINAVIDALKDDKGDWEKTQSTVDYELLQRMIRDHGLSNVVFMLAQACGNVNPCDGSLVSEDYDRAEEILQIAATGVDYYYERDNGGSHTSLRHDKYEEMMTMLAKVHP